MNLEGLVRSASGHIFHEDGSDLTEQEWQNLADQSMDKDPDLDTGSDFKAYVAGFLPLGEEAEVQPEIAQAPRIARPPVAHPARYMPPRPGR